MAGSFSAQSFTGKINSSPSTEPLQVNNLNVFAVMVEFQEDDDNVTFGDGTFGSIYSGDNATSQDIIDPLPHDKLYFENHLYFAQNYFKKVSDGKFTIDFTVFDNVITVSQTMRNYSPPPRESDDLTNVAGFAKEVWTIVEQQYGGQVDFSQYDVFAIFHAGVGRDVNLPGSIGNERDLPSVYLSESTLKNIYGDDFTTLVQGVDGLNHTMVLPCTESREISTVGGSTLLELSINGLIVSSVASHLGLPDLFNTETGLSAIGRFGLMDGQSIFAFGGLFPPEPSPWEKMYLGWIDPVEVTNESLVSLTTRLKATGSDTSYIKIPINSKEYYLVENRQRDAEGDGCNLTYYSNGDYSLQRFTKDTTWFASYAVDSAKGVVVNVDEFDWAVPGSGVVVWHIDESVIEAKMATNDINNDKTRRGVDVEEADGVQDIGETFYTALGDEVIGEGSEEDLWYSSNEAKLYENEFSPYSKPNTYSNLGGNSLISVTDFSDIANKMTFKVSFGDNSIEKVLSSSVQNTSSAREVVPFYDNNSNIDGFVVGTDDSKVQIYDADFNLEAELDYQNKYVIPFNTDFGKHLLVVGDHFRIYKQLNNGSWEAVVTDAVVNETITSNVVFYRNTSSKITFVFGTSNGNVNTYTYEVIPNDYTTTRTEISVSSESIHFVNTNDSGFFFAVANDLYYYGNSVTLQRSGSISQTASVNTASGDNYEILLAGDLINSMGVLKSGESYKGFPLYGDIKIARFALAEKGGDVSIAYASQNKVFACNLQGSMDENYPVALEDTVNLTSTVLSFDITEDGAEDLFTISTDGIIYAFDGLSGEMISGFPLTAGKQQVENYGMSIYSNDSGTFLSVLSDDGSFEYWMISELKNKKGWLNVNGGNYSGVYELSDQSSAGSDYFPSAKVYNWPNPVYDELTNIRYYVSEDSNISIKIFDLGGELVRELKDFARGGFDNETVWYVDNVQSGVYFARVEVNSIESGKSDYKIIKIAVIK